MELVAATAAAAFLAEGITTIVLNAAFAVSSGLSVLGDTPVAAATPNPATFTVLGAAAPGNFIEIVL